MPKRQCHHAWSPEIGQGAVSRQWNVTSPTEDPQKSAAEPAERITPCFCRSHLFEWGLVGNWVWNVARDANELGGPERCWGLWRSTGGGRWVGMDDGTWKRHFGWPTAKFVLARLGGDDLGHARRDAKLSAPSPRIERKHAPTAYLQRCGSHRTATASILGKYLRK